MKYVPFGSRESCWPGLSPRSIPGGAALRRARQTSDDTGIVKRPVDSSSGGHGGSPPGSVPDVHAGLTDARGREWRAERPRSPFPRERQRRGKLGFSFPRSRWVERHRDPRHSPPRQRIWRLIHRDSPPQQAALKGFAARARDDPLASSPPEQPAEAGSAIITISSFGGGEADSRCSVQSRHGPSPLTGGGSVRRALPGWPNVYSASRFCPFAVEGRRRKGELRVGAVHKAVLRMLLLPPTA